MIRVIDFSKYPCQNHNCTDPDGHLAGERHIIPDDDGFEIEVCVTCYLKYHGVHEE